ERAGLGLAAEEIQQVAPRPDEDDACLAAPACEGAVLAQEAVTGMDRVASLVRRGGDDAGGVEISSGTHAGERAGAVPPTALQRRSIVRREHGDGRDAELARGAGDPDRDLAPVGDEQTLRQHDGSATISPRPFRVDPGKSPRQEDAHARQSRLPSYAAPASP